MSALQCGVSEHVRGGGEILCAVIGLVLEAGAVSRRREGDVRSRERHGLRLGGWRAHCCSCLWVSCSVCNCSRLVISCLLLAFLQGLHQKV